MLVKSMAVFDAPPIPGCWQGGEVIRIVDPLGLQVAWVSPALAGGIVGYYVREVTSDEWTEVLACSTRAGRKAGSALLLRDDQSGRMKPVQGAEGTWTFASRDPTQAIVSGRIQDHELTVSLQCADGELHIGIASAEGPEHLPETGLRLYVGAGVGHLEARTSHDGELDFHGGVLQHMSLVHPPALQCRVQEGAGGDCQVDLLPAPFSPAAAPDYPLAITLVPRLSERSTTA